LARRVVTGC